MNFTQTAKLYAPVFATVVGIVSTLLTNNIFTLFGCIAVGLIISGICALNSIAESTPVKPQVNSAATSKPKRKETTMYVVNPNSANCFPGMNIGGHTNFL
ncbi:hypothetical protein F0267_01185 [Vibrio coralliilyticus]|uniref:Uncharacterized protein n=1 Tax=Vibrio coralliilyticus TaxID=190893 RepID=A0AAN0W108_9VIBR|nr:hypothetical protein [Vibrio coralliilyticus]AIW22281.1 hypothetical protein IX92_24745 [Vibrio coralliilyticus]NOH36836.1 hypothetical protein [Vibrio coralliilyticus]